MKITVFSSNQPRHLSFIEQLVSIASEVCVVQEVTTVFPGQIADFYTQSPSMKRYFQRVQEAERQVFGEIRPLPSGTRVTSMRMGDLNQVSQAQLHSALNSEVYVVFGSSFIKGWLIDFLVEKRCFNLHIGVSPYYRGNSTNFWALYDRHPEYVGATIHYLTKGLDSGPILFHALPAVAAYEPFELGMRAVQAAHLGFIKSLKENPSLQFQSQPQDRSRELRYSRKNDFTDDIVEEYLNRMASPQELEAHLAHRDLSRFTQPYVPNQKELTKIRKVTSGP